MAKKQRLNVQGLRQLERNLGELFRRISGDDALRIASDAAGPVRDRIQAEAPVLTGELRDSVEKGEFPLDPRKPVAAFVAPNRDRLDPPNKAMLVEFGTLHAEANPFFKRGVSRSSRSAASTMLRAYKALVEAPYKT